MTSPTIPLYQQISDKFEDPNYEAITRKEMGSPDCLKRPMYVVGKESKVPAVFRKTASKALTIIGIITVLPAIYWTMKSIVEFVLLPVSSRILRAVMRTAREKAIIPKGKLHSVIEVIKVIAKIALITAAVVAAGYALGLGLGGLIGIGVATFAVAGIYEIFKAIIIRQTAAVIKFFYADHIATGPKHMRMSVMVDGERIDTYVVMHGDKIEASQRWILATNGNAFLAEIAVGDLVKYKNKTEQETKELDSTKETNEKTVEEAAEQPDDPLMLTKLAKGLRANVVTFNYSGCVGSEGQVTAAKTARVFQAMKKMLEDQDGLAAGQIVFYGHSIGGAMQAKGLEGLTPDDFNPNIRYVCVKDRTFANSDRQIGAMFPGKFGKFLRSAVKRFGWNLNVQAQCEELYANKIPQVNLNHRVDLVIRGVNALVRNYGEFQQTDLDKQLVKSFASQYVKPARPAIPAANGKKAVPEIKPDAHSDAFPDNECNEIVAQIETMLAYDRN